MGSSGTPPAITRAPPKTPPPRPKSAAFRRAESGFAPCPTRPPAAGLTGAQGLAAQARGTYLQNGVGGIGSGGEASPDGRLEFRGRDHQKTTAHRVQHRLRPRSAVARVESTSRHGKVRTRYTKVAFPKVPLVCALLLKIFVNHNRYEGSSGVDALFVGSTRNVRQFS